ncbi:hypothetical protein NXS19_007617 [Fusarium pseudograminearum]|nr:hypothetical protein NXS19_007617 [Fusarium pseudograminearum]
MGHLLDLGCGKTMVEVEKGARCRACSLLSFSGNRHGGSRFGYSRTPLIISKFATVSFQYAGCLNRCTVIFVLV